MRYYYQADPTAVGKYLWFDDCTRGKPTRCSEEELQDVIKATKLLGYPIEEIRSAAPSRQIVVSYPPESEYNGELHIKAQPNIIGIGKNALEVQSYSYYFTHSNRVAADGNKRDPQNDWRTLVCAAKAIVAQDDRIREAEKLSNLDQT